MLSKLIISTDNDSLSEKINNILDKFSVSKFDRVVLNEDNHAIGIEEIRELKQKLNLQPFSGKYKALIIHFAEKLTTESQNALLKTLEEPPENTIILLTTTNENLLLPTIVSRCEITRIQSSKFKVQSSKQNIPVDQLDIGERFKLAEELTKKKDKDEPLESVRKRVEKWLAELINYVRQTENNEAKLNNLKVLINSQKQIRQNLNIRLVLENLFLNLL